MDPEDTEFQAPSTIPDGPTELPPDPGERELQAAPPSAEEPAGEETKPQPEPAYKYDPRNEIFARRSQILAAEQAGSDSAFDESRAAGRGLPGSEPAPAQPAAIAPSGEFVTIKVYGEERQAPRDEVEKAGGVAAYQKAVAADVKLQRASEAEARLKTEEQRLLRIAENLRQGLDEHGQPLAPARPPTPGAPTQAISKEALDSTVKALYSGDEAQATAALGTLIDQITSRAATTAPVSPDIVRTVEERVLGRLSQDEQLRREQQDVEAANRVFRDRYKDIAADPDLMSWAKGLANQLTADPEFQGKSRAEIAEAVGARITAKVKPAPAPADPLQARRKLKESLPKTSQGQQRAAAPAPQGFPTNKDYIEQLRRNSGSNSAPR